MKRIGQKQEELNYYEMFVNNANIALEISTILKEFVEEYDFKG